MSEPIGLSNPHNALLLLADGTVFYGYGIGVVGKTTGEICFNTSMTGYQEVLSDPSYAGQIITFTFPHIGNVGTTPEDMESKKIVSNGLIIREAITAPSNFRSTSPLESWLKENELTGICGIDTRALTRHIRLNGAQNVTIIYAEDNASLPKVETLKEDLDAQPSLAGMDLAKNVSCSSPYQWNQTQWQLGEGFGKTQGDGYHIVVIDFGIKLNILRSLADRGCKITVVPAGTGAGDILALSPDGIFLSNGPGDPAATGVYAVPTIQALMNAGMPIFGICLGHQLLSLAMGAKTEKMHQGHRGANHPVQDRTTNIVEITSQNHGFVVSHGSLSNDVKVTHSSLFDGTIEGVSHKRKPAFSVQYHPESSPGPHDSQYLFDRFLKMISESSIEFSV